MMFNNLFFEAEDERGVLLKKVPFDRGADEIFTFLQQKYPCETIHLTRWIPYTNTHYRYEGTAHLKDGDVVPFQVTPTGRMYHLKKSEVKNFRAGKELRDYSSVEKYKFNLRD